MSSFSLKRNVEIDNLMGIIYDTPPVQVFSDEHKSRSQSKKKVDFEDDVKTAEYGKHRPERQKRIGSLGHSSNFTQNFNPLDSNDVKYETQNNLEFDEEELFGINEIKTSIKSSNKKAEITVG